MKGHGSPTGSKGCERLLCRSETLVLEQSFLRRLCRSRRRHCRRDTLPGATRIVRTLGRRFPTSGPLQTRQSGRDARRLPISVV